MYSAVLGLLFQRKQSTVKETSKDKLIVLTMAARDPASVGWEGSEAVNMAARDTASAG